MSLIMQAGEQRLAPGNTNTLLSISGKNICIDFGMAIGNKAAGEANYLSKMTELSTKLDLILLTHHHLDHSGGLPFIAKMNPNAIIAMTEPTGRGAEIMLKDSLKIHNNEQKAIIRAGGEAKQFFYNEEDISSLFKRSQKIPKPGWYQIWPGWEFGFYSAGHTRGATMIIILPPDGLAYLVTGDISSHDQPLIKGVMLPPKEFFGDRLKNRKIIIITETTYGNRELKAPMANLRKEFREWAKDRIEKRMPLLLPSFGDRGPGTLKDLTDIGIACHVDGMVREFCQMYQNYTWCPQDIKLELDALIKNKLAIPYKKLGAESAQEDRVGEEIHRHDTDLGNCCGMGKPSPIISSSAMMDKGMSVVHAERILPNRNAAVAFTGYVFPNSVGEQVLKVQKGGNVKMNTWDAKERREITKNIPVSCEVAHFSLSGHDPADKLVERIVRMHEEYCPVELVIGHHGDTDSYNGFERRIKAANLNIPAKRAVHLKEIQID